MNYKQEVYKKLKNLGWDVRHKFGTSYIEFINKEKNVKIPCIDLAKNNLLEGTSFIRCNERTFDFLMQYLKPLNEQNY